MAKREHAGRAKGESFSVLRAQGYWWNWRALQEKDEAGVNGVGERAGRSAFKSGTGGGAA